MNIQDSPPYALASYFSENYDQARNAFINAALRNPTVSLIENIFINAKDFNNEPLSIDIAWLGALNAKKILIHIGGTHGVEGFAGSAIACSLLKNPIKTDDDTAIIFVHALNCFGMALNRRVNENNVDLNRNFTDDRRSHPLYAKINNLINPSCHAWIDFFHLKAIASILWYGWSNVLQAIAGGQYDFPEGLFYGGNKLEEGPQKLLAWFEKKFSEHRYRDELRVGVIDHTGLGPKGRDFLLAIDENLKQFLKVHSGGDVQGQAGRLYALKECVYRPYKTIERVTQCASAE